MQGINKGVLSERFYEGKIGVLRFRLHLQSLPA